MEFSRLAIIKMLNLSDKDFKEYCQIPVPCRKYSSDDEKIDADKCRKAASEKFFDQRSYRSPQDLFSYSDLKEEANEAIQSFETTEVTI